MFSFRFFVRIVVSPPSPPFCKPKPVYRSMRSHLFLRVCSENRGGWSMIPSFVWDCRFSEARYLYFVFEGHTVASTPKIPRKCSCKILLLYKKILEEQRLVVNQIIEEGSGEAYWKARVESQGKVGVSGRPPQWPWDVRKWHRRQ